jgi:hypothetical protein
LVERGSVLAPARRVERQGLEHRDAESSPQALPALRSLGIAPLAAPFACARIREKIDEGLRLR